MRSQNGLISLRAALVAVVLVLAICGVLGFRQWRASSAEDDQHVTDFCVALSAPGADTSDC